VSTQTLHDLHITEQLVEFKPPKRQFTLHNSREKDIDVSYVSHLMTVPGKNRISVHRPALDADGDKIPGTLVIEDVYVFSDETGDEELTFDSARAVAHVLGIQRAGGALVGASSRYAHGGLSLLPPKPTKDIWRAVLADGERRAFLIEVDNARQTVEATASRNSARAKAGMGPIPGGPNDERATWILKEYETLYRKEAADYVASQDKTSRTSEERSIDDDIEFEVFARAMLRDLVRDTATELRKSGAAEVDEEKLLMELLEKPALRMKVQKKYRIRKVGHQAPSEETLKAAEAAGLTVSDIEKDE
jgi:hypothetical protein